jgi:hypothetical protein
MFSLHLPDETFVVCLSGDVISIVKDAPACIHRTRGPNELFGKYLVLLCKLWLKLRRGETV